MFEKKELISLVIGIILMSILVSFISLNKEVIIQRIPLALIISIVVISVSVLAKKITARKIDMKINHKIFEWEKYWWSKGSHFRKPIPMGVLLPLVLLFLSAGIIKFFAFFEFKSEALISKVAKKYGRYRFSNISEWDDALIGFYGMLAVVFIAITARFLVSFQFFPFIELSKYSLYYALYNIIPFSKHSRGNILKAR